MFEWLPTSSCILTKWQCKQKEILQIPVIFVQIWIIEGFRRFVYGNKGRVTGESSRSHEFFFQNQEITNQFWLKTAGNLLLFGEQLLG